MSPKLKPPRGGWIGENGVECTRSGPSWSATASQRGQAEASERCGDAGDQLSASEADMEALWQRGGGGFKAPGCGPEQQSRQGGEVPETGLATGAGQVQR